MKESAYRVTDAAGRMADAANALVNALYQDQRARGMMEFEATDERVNWHYVPKARPGLSLKEMEPPQRHLALALVATGLSRKGDEKARLIIEIEELLGKMEGAGRKFTRDNELYYVSIFGSPGTAAWGWRFEGHHISLNYTIVDGMVAPTPLFFGSNPAQVMHGEREGLRALREEEDLGRELLHALDPDQRRQAVIQPEAPADILTRDRPYVEGSVTPEGVAAAGLTAAQRQILEALVETYIGRLPEEMAEAERVRVAGVEAKHSLHFAWAGGAERGKGHYYRIQGPLFLAEYDNTQNDANHIHTVWRDLRNDFGQDLLRRHYTRSH